MRCLDPLRVRRFTEAGLLGQISYPRQWWLYHGTVCSLHLLRPRSRWCRTSGNGTVPACTCCRRLRFRRLGRFGSCAGLVLLRTVFHTSGTCIPVFG